MAKKKRPQSAASSLMSGPPIKALRARLTWLRSEHDRLAAQMKDRRQAAASKLRRGGNSPNERERLRQWLMAPDPDASGDVYFYALRFGIGAVERGLEEGDPASAACGMYEAMQAWAALAYHDSVTIASMAEIDSIRKQTPGI